MTARGADEGLLEGPFLSSSRLIYVLLDLFSHVETLKDSELVEGFFYY